MESKDEVPSFPVEEEYPNTSTIVDWKLAKKSTSSKMSVYNDRNDDDDSDDDDMDQYLSMESDLDAELDFKPPQRKSTYVSKRIPVAPIKNLTTRRKQKTRFQDNDFQENFQPNFDLYTNPQSNENVEMPRDLLTEESSGVRLKSDRNMDSVKLLENRTEFRTKVPKVPKILPVDLMLGKKQLKNINVASYDTVELTRKEVIDEHKMNNDFVPLDTVMSDLARKAIMGNQIKSLNLSGVEQLTDMFFYILKRYEVKVQNLETLNLTGCNSISDIAIKWITDYIPSLQVLVAKGCRNITEKSLFYLFSDKAIFNSIQFNSTSVSAVSPKMNVNVIGLMGCPLISPPTDTYRRNVKSVFMGIETVELHIYKVVILQNQLGAESIGEKMTNVSNTNKEGFRVWKNWRPKEDNQCAFNVYEVVVGSGYEGLVLGNGQIVILPYSEDDEPTSKYLAKQIVTILSQFPETVFVLCPIKELKSDSMESKVNEELKEWESRIGLTLESFVTQKYALEEHKYHDQIIFTAGQFSLESLQQKHIMCPPSPSKPNSVDYDFLCKAVEKLKTEFPWHGIGYFKETLQILKTMPGMGLPPVTMAELYTQIPDDSKFVLNTRSEFAAHAEISKVLELMRIRGLCLYFPELQDSPVVGDVTTFQEFLGELLEAKAPQALPIKGLGKCFPCWTVNDLKKLAKGRISVMLKILEHFGIAIAVPCDCQQINFDDSYVYILMKDLPEKSLEHTEHIFPADLLETDPETHADRYYLFHTCHPAMLFPMFLSNLSKIAQFSLLWKTGAVFHHGPVTILVELLANCEGTPTIIISARMQAPHKNKTLKHLVEEEEPEDLEQELEENEANEETNEKMAVENKKTKETKQKDSAKFWVSFDNVRDKMLWYTFNNVANVLDCILQKYKIYATKAVPCNGCVPTGNRYTALEKYTADKKQKENVVYFYRTLSIESGHIKVHCTKDTSPVINREIFIGPKIQKLSLHVPNHYGDTVQTQVHKFESTASKENDVEEKEKNTRCFLCQNCCVNGIECKQNNKNESISRRCGCNQKGDLCIHCGICARCVQKLAESFSTIYPSFLPQKVATDKVNRSGSMVSYMDQNALYEFKDFLSLEYFNHIKICLIRGAFLSIGFVDYSGGQSVLHTKYDTEFGNFTTESDVLQEGAKCKEGDLLEIQVISMSSDLSEPGVQIKLNGGIIHFMQLPSRKTKLSCVAKRPAVISVQTPGLMSMVSEPEKTSKAGAKGYEGLWFTPCSGYLPTIPEVKMSHMLSDVEWYLFRNHRVDFNGASAVVLPSNVTENHLLYPSYRSLWTNQRCHPLCMTRTNSRDMILASQSMMSRFIHFTNAEGYAMNDEVLQKTAILIWGWHAVITHYPKIGIPPLDKLLPEIAKSTLAVDTVQHGLRELLRLQMLRLYLQLGEGFSILSFKKVKYLDTVSLELLENLEDNFPSCGLHKTESDLVTNKVLYLCESHKNAWSIGLDLLQIPPDFFSGHAQFIADLHLSKNQLVSLPEAMFVELTNLHVIHMTDNFIEEIPKSIAHCKKLLSLDFRENNLTDLPECLVECASLCRLDISSNLMDRIPPVVTKLTSLERLMCSNMMLTELPEDIGNLENLKMLYALGNCFTALPKSIVKLQKLEDLGLMGVAWFKVKVNTLVSKQKFEDFLQSRNIMRWLDAHNEDKTELFKQFDEDANGTLDAKELGKLNATLFTIFPRFGYKGDKAPDDNTPSGFPPEILELKNLRYLSLQYQGIVHVPDGIGQLTQLDSLILSCNPNLLSVSAQAGSIPLKRLELDECPLLKTPPKEIRDRGFVTVYAYMKRLLSGSVECKRTKLMLVGLGGAGKTSLVRALLSDENKATLTGAEAITDGIDICTWKVPYENESISYSVWDFAGQTVYYNTHQFFLSNRAVYFLLWNVRLGFEHSGLNFWLSSISVHAPKAPIFVVGTHVDQVSKVELPTEEMKQTYPQIKGFFFVSSHTGQGLSHLKSELINVTLQEKYMGEKIPGAWLDLENAVLKKKEEDQIDVMDYVKVEKLANRSGIVDRVEIAQAVQFLHDLGALQHFTNEYLKSRVVINPQWIVDVMACVVSVKQSAIVEGRLKHVDKTKIWADYPQEYHDWLLRLTEEYDLTFPLPGESANLVPCLLPEKKPEINWPEVSRDSNMRDLKIAYKFHYLPAGLFNRGQVRLHQFSDSSLMWKRGSFLKKNEHICLIQQVRDSELVVRVHGPRPENILFMVHEVFEGLIVESFQGVTYDYEVPCPDCIKGFLKDPHMFLASTIRRAIELKAPFLQCLKYFHTITVEELQASMPPDTSSDFDVHLVHAVSGLQDLRRSMAIDIFCSYCHKNCPKDKSDPLHPLNVCKDLEKEGYTCWYNKTGDRRVTEEMARSLIDSSVFIVFMSTEYAEDKDCSNMFKYALLTLKKPVIIVRVGDGDYGWRKGQLGLFLSDTVFIDMTEKKKAVYKDKFKDLLKKLDEMMNQALGASKETPECFISYCWSNSAQAVSLGSNKGSISGGDPREIKEYMEKNGVPCWIDVEQVGVNGLFEDIAKGLLNARVMIACISDEYAESANCLKEFRYAANILRLPIVVVVVGSGHTWKMTEVGFLSLMYPIVNFQKKNKDAHENLLDYVKEYLAKDQGYKKPEEKKKQKDKDNEQRNQQSFQELYELAQRKFIRQISTYAASQDVYPYPRLFVLDIVKRDESEDNDISPAVMGSSASIRSVQVRENPAGFRSRQFCVYTLCECEEGWHSVSEPLVLPDDFSTSLLEEYAPYLSRITVIMKHSNELVLNCLTDPDGHQFTTWLDETSASIVTGFEKTYHEFRQQIINLDKDRVMGKLQRCRLPSGKTIWLCEGHISKMRVTVMSNEEVTSEHIPRSTADVDFMTDALRKLDHKSIAIKFKSSKKTKRKPVPKKNRPMKRSSTLARESSLLNMFPDLKNQLNEEKPVKISEEQDQQQPNQPKEQEKQQNQQEPQQEELKKELEEQKRLTQKLQEEKLEQQRKIEEEQKLLQQKQQEELQKQLEEQQKQLQQQLEEQKRITKELEQQKQHLGQQKPNEQQKPNVKNQNSASATSAAEKPKSKACEIM